MVANDQKRPMYECIQVYSYREQESVLNEEGDLDNESDDSDFEMEMMRKSGLLNALNLLVLFISP